MSRRTAPARLSLALLLATATGCGIIVDGSIMEVKAPLPSRSTPR
jgi:hypothetical protein